MKKSKYPSKLPLNLPRKWQEKQLANLYKKNRKVRIMFIQKANKSKIKVAEVKNYKKEN